MNVIDVSIPDQIKEVANKTYQFQLYSVQGKVITSGNYAFAVIKDGSLLVFDVTNQSNPTIIGEWSSEKATLRDITLSGEHLYAATYKGLIIIDVHDPSAPEEVGGHLGFRKSGNSIAVSDEYVFMAGSNGLHIFELLD